MTFAARKVLSDCRVALELLESEKDLQKWRIHWVAAVALIRTVGHVLNKVDGHDLDLKSIAKKRYKSWRADENNIFNNFIEKERNLILKEYQLSIHPLDEVPVLVQVQLQPLHSGRPDLVSGYVDALEDNIYRPMLDSAWEGYDARDVYKEAVKWWEKQLNAIDSEVARLKSDKKRSE